MIRWRLWKAQIRRQKKKTFLFATKSGLTTKHLLSGSKKFQAALFETQIWTNSKIKSYYNKIVNYNCLILKYVIFSDENNITIMYNSRVLLRLANVGKIGNINWILEGTV